MALVAFTGVAASVPGGLAGTQPAGSPVAPLSLPNLVVLALADALVAGLLGYRAAALRTASARDALWAAADLRRRDRDRGGGGPGARDPAAHRAGAADVLFYLWDALHAAPPSRRRDPRWLWETAILLGLGIAGRRLEPPAPVR